jgi:uncharacterized protein YjbJ (UPF0337 family)
MTTNDPMTGADTGDRSQQGGRATAVAELARDDAASTADTAKEQAGRVTDEARHQVQDLAEDARSQLRSQAETQTANLGRTMDDWGGRLHALADGRAEEAGEVQDLTHRIADGMQGLADRIDELGFDGAVSELQRFARRRPGAFLAGAAVLGFAASRLAQGTRENHSNGDSGSSNGAQSSMGAQTTPATSGTGTATHGAPAPAAPPPPPLFDDAPEAAEVSRDDPAAITPPSGRTRL